MHNVRFFHSVGPVIFLLLVLVLPCSAQPQDSILIRNATLIDRGGSPLLSGSESTLLHLGAGLRQSSSKEDFMIQTGPEFNRAPNHVVTAFFEPDKSMTYQAEVSLRSGPF
jgi:hypothetical protein